LDDAPIDAFGVGTRMTTSADVPSLDVVYKLVEDHTGPRMKTSTGKVTLPGRKQAYRTEAGDTIALVDESGVGGDPLLTAVMERGGRLHSPENLKEIRARTLAGLDRLPGPLRSLEKADPPYPVRRSPGVERLVALLSERAAG
jgi:nicotinate phosphoribosyltransferase